MTEQELRLLRAFMLADGPLTGPAAAALADHPNVKGSRELRMAETPVRSLMDSLLAARLLDRAPGNRGYRLTQVGADELRRVEAAERAELHARWEAVVKG